MPSTNNRQLTLTRDGTNVTITVTYNAVFTPLERHLANLGFVFRDRITVIGVDPAGSTHGTDLMPFPHPGSRIPVTDGDVNESIPRNRSMTVPRASLNEDTGLLDADEIRCRIQIQFVGMPPEITPPAYTDQEVLSEVVVVP